LCFSVDLILIPKALFISDIVSNRKGHVKRWSFCWWFEIYCPQGSLT
jgi:hypothetical protein